MNNGIQPVTKRKQPEGTWLIEVYHSREECREGTTILNGIRYHSHHMELLERASQLQVLNSALSQVKAREGQGCVALVYGEAGIGKTSLVEYFINEHRAKWRILQGACDSLFTPRPLGPLHDIAPQAQGSLLSLLESEYNRTAIFSACLNELQQKATILVIEDVHWADEATLDLLKYLGRRIRQTVSLMILTYRDDEIGADHSLRILLGDLASSHALHRIPVLSLSKEAVHELAKNKKVDSAELHRLTNGNPFFVTEVLAVESGVPESVRDAVLARAAQLSLSARSVLEAAAVIGSRAEAWLLSIIVGAKSVHIEECIARGMLQSQGEYYAFRHELARQTILESIALQRKITLHRLALNTLKESPETRNDLARLANHAEGAKDANAVLEYAPAAARQASALGAHRQASAHYRTALQHVRLLSTEERAEILDRYSNECDVTNQMAEAKQAQQEALRLWQKLGQREKEGRALRRLSEIVMRLDQKSEMDRYASEAIRVLEALPPSKELAMAYSHKSRIHMIVYQVSETHHWGQRAIDLAEQLGDARTLIHALTTIGIIEMWHNQRVEGQMKLERSWRLSLEYDYHHYAARALYNLANGLIALFDYGTCQRYVGEGLGYCASHDLDNWQMGLLSIRAQANFEQGRWAEAELDINAAEKIPGEVEMRSRMDLLRSRLQIRRGDHQSPEALDKLRRIALHAVFHEVVYPIAELFAESAWLQNDLARCRAEAEPMFQIACQLNVPIYIGHLAFWMWRAGAITELPPNTAEPYASQILANWREAASMWERFGCPYEQAMALMDGDEAAQLAALEIFERLGARPIIEKLKGQLRAQGIRIPRGPRPATRENSFGLTAREREVLSYLAKGLSNNAIAQQLSLSTRTVEHHIASIVQKMGVESRHEATALALKYHLLQSD
jgi:DNA-binding CsgD family transcriptional regulator